MSTYLVGYFQAIPAHFGRKNGHFIPYVALQCHMIARQAAFDLYARFDDEEFTAMYQQTYLDIFKLFFAHSYTKTE